MGSSMMLFPLFQEMGITGKETESILDNNAGLRIMPSESIRSRIQLLQLAGINGVALSKLIVEQSDVLTSEEVGALLCFIIDDNNLGLKGKINPSQIGRLLNTKHPRFLVGFKEKVQLLLHFGIPKEKLGHVLNTLNLIKALCRKPLEELERMLAFLQRFRAVDLIIRRPAFLNYDLETQVIPKIEFLLDLSGGDENATGIVLRKLPSVLAYTVDHLSHHVEFLKSYAGLSYEEIFRIVLVRPSFFTASKKRKLHPRIDFLKQCGLSSNDIFRFLIEAPLFLNLSFEENLANKLVLLVKIGYGYRTRELALAMGAATRCSCKNLQEVISVLLNYGLTCEDICNMTRKYPRVLQYNPKSLKEKMDYLIEEMGSEVWDFLSFPAFLGYKFHGRIKHRFEEWRKVQGEGMSTNKLLSVSVARFPSKSKTKGPTITMRDLIESEA